MLVLERGACAIHPNCGHAQWRAVVRSYVQKLRSYSYILTLSGEFFSSASLLKLRKPTAMPRSLILLFFGTLVLVTCASAYNETETPEATGERVVNDVLDRFNETGLETDENVLLFMRRMAWVESQFGGYNLTFRQGFHGGIWQKSLKAFRMTQKENTMKHQQIKDLLEINWEKVPWSECRKPLYSALTVWLYLCLSPTPIPELLEEQAEFWVEYKKECAPMVQDFIDHVKVLEG